MPRDKEPNYLPNISLVPVEDFGKLLYRLRRSKGYTSQGDFADALDIAQGAYSFVELRKGKNISYKLVDSVSQLLGVRFMLAVVMDDADLKRLQAFDEHKEELEEKKRVLAEKKQL